MDQAKTDWEVVMSVCNPNKSDGFGGGRPRRMSIHTIAAMCKRDPHVVLMEMRESGDVVGYSCPDVQCTIFYLKSMAKLPKMIDTRSDGCWDTALADLKAHPYPATKGFFRDADAREHGYAAKVPFIPRDKAYEDAIKDALAEWKKKNKS